MLNILGEAGKNTDPANAFPDVSFAVFEYESDDHNAVWVCNCPAEDVIQTVNDRAANLKEGGVAFAVPIAHAAQGKIVG